VLLVLVLLLLGTLIFRHSPQQREEGKPSVAARFTGMSSASGGGKVAEYSLFNNGNAPVTLFTPCVIEYRPPPGVPAILPRGPRSALVISPHQSVVVQVPPPPLKQAWRPVFLCDVQDARQITWDASRARLNYWLNHFGMRGLPSRSTSFPVRVDWIEE
jgi:hypothetical protein